ncbi:MAG: hypothetical protein AB8I69_13305 [Anaerolineae bacterium]
MNIPQAISQIQRLPGLRTESNHVSDAVVIHMLHYMESASPGLPATPGLLKPVLGLATAVSFTAATAPAVQAAGILLLPETIPTLRRKPWTRSPLEIAQDAMAYGLKQVSALQQGMLTQHALMVAYGEFAHAIGLISGLAKVKAPQKSVVHVPYGKILSFFMGTLSGITHLKDLNEGPHPLAHDWPAMRAWGLVAMAHYSGISRTLAACDPKTVEAITQVLHEVSQPFIDQEVRLLRGKGQPLLLDLDLAPRGVSNTSTTFPDAEFGWQGDGVGLGYDAAVVAFSCPTYGRLFVSGFHYPRNPVALPRLQKMVRAAEQRLGLCPRRRMELVAYRLKTLEQTMTQRSRWLNVQLDKVKTRQAQLAVLPDTISQLETRITALETHYCEQGRAEKPHSKLAKTRRQLASARTKLAKAPLALQKAQQAVATHQARLADLHAEHELLTAHLHQLRADNARNTDPVTIIVRIDAGFGTGPNIAWLLEMGYTIYTKAHNAQVSASLLRQVTPESKWQRVGKNAEMLAFGQRHISNCPYPLTVALERFHTPQGLKHSTLIAYRDDGQCLTLPAWFDFYNARQTIEAGIKETNVVFKMHPLKMRSKGGIALQEQFALFAANFARFAAVWLRQRVHHTTPRFDNALTSVKMMVRVAANTSAWVFAEGDSLLVRFDDTGAYPDVELQLDGGWLACPPILPRKKIQNLDFGDGFSSGCT